MLSIICHAPIIMYPVNDVTVCGSFNWCLICRDRFTFEGAGLLVCAAAMSAVERNSESADSSNDEVGPARATTASG